jgi:hypothetical protein
MVESADAIAEASAAELDGAAFAKAVRAGSVMSSADAVGMNMVAVPARSVVGELTVGFAWAAAGADRKPPFPGELTVGFPGELKAPTAALMVPATEVAVGVSMDAVPVPVAAKRVLDAADCKPPFPRELMVGFPVKSKPPTAAALTGVLLAVASGVEKGAETRRLLDFPMGGEQMELKELSPSSVFFCRLLLLENWVVVLCLDQVSTVLLLLHF